MPNCKVLKDLLIMSTLKHYLSHVKLLKEPFLVYIDRIVKIKKNRPVNIWLIMTHLGKNLKMLDQSLKESKKLHTFKQKYRKILLEKYND